MVNQYEQNYAQEAFYWTKKPSKICFKALEILPVDRPMRLIDIGCGEGRNAVFFARNGFDVTAFDSAESGVEKTLRFAEEASVKINAFQANMLEYRLDEPFDVIFSSGCLQYIPPQMRNEVLDNYKQHTNPGGLNVLSAFVNKPFIGKSPDAETTAHKWISGELFTHYHDWRIDHCEEAIFDCMSSGVPHQHATNRMIAVKPTS